MEKNKIISSFTTQNVYNIILCNNLREQLMKCAINKTNDDNTDNNRICSKIKQEFMEYKCNYN
jgi:chromosome condensin MukBEF MukE localization factor